MPARRNPGWGPQRQPSHQHDGEHDHGRCESHVERGGLCQPSSGLGCRSNGNDGIGVCKHAGLRDDGTLVQLDASRTAERPLADERLLAHLTAASQPELNLGLHGRQR